MFVQADELPDLPGREGGFLWASPGRKLSAPPSLLPVHFVGGNVLIKYQSELRERSLMAH